MPPGLTWPALVRRGMPRRAVAGSGLYDQRQPGMPERAGWRIWHSAGGQLRVEDDQGVPVWIWRTDGVSFFDFSSGIPSRVAPEEGWWDVEEPVKWAQYMLRPSALGSFCDFAGWRFEAGPAVGSGRRIVGRNAAEGLLELTLDEALGMITEIRAPDADPPEYIRIRDWIPGTPDPELFRWRGPYRDTRRDLP